MIWIISSLLTISLVLKYWNHKRTKKEYMTDLWIRDNIYREGKKEK